MDKTFDSNMFCCILCSSIISFS